MNSSNRSGHQSFGFAPTRNANPLSTRPFNGWNSWKVLAGLKYSWQMTWSVPFGPQSGPVAFNLLDNNISGSSRPADPIWIVAKWAVNGEFGFEYIRRHGGKLIHNFEGFRASNAIVESLHAQPRCLFGRPGASVYHREVAVVHSTG